MSATRTTERTDVLADDASRAEIIQALTTANAEARRMESRDHLSRPSAAWTAKHRWINYLLTMLERSA